MLTPHPGEAARLLGRRIPAEPEGRAEAACEIARRAGAVCCLKGAATVVSDGERTYVNDTGNPGMATAGAGDVLAGILGALLAGGPPAFERAAFAVRVHGLAGDRAARALGARSVVASDLIDHLPGALRELEEER